MVKITVSDTVISEIVDQWYLSRSPDAWKFSHFLKIKYNISHMENWDKDGAVLIFANELDATLFVLKNG